MISPYTAAAWVHNTRGGLSFRSHRFKQNRIGFTPDASRRVLRRLLTPKLQHDGTFSDTPMEFLDWIHPRLVPALQLYVKYTGRLPREICMTLARMFEMLGDGRFIDSLQCKNKRHIDILTHIADHKVNLRRRIVAVELARQPIPK